MKNLLTTTALVAVSTTAVLASNDNFKVQLDNIDNAFQCQNHFDKDGADIAGTINQFEFCVWYLNNNREAFFRDINWYGILPTGDVIATRDYNFSSKNKAEKAITAEIEKIVAKKTAEAKAAAEANADKRIAEVVAQAEMTEDTLRAEIDSLMAQLVAATAGTIDPVLIAELSAQISAQTTEIEDLTACLLYTSPSPRDS